MARIRTIKPEFPQSESMGRVSRDARLLFVNIWTLCDDAGRARGNSRMLASLLYPYDDDAKDLIEGWLGELELEGCVFRYQFEGSHYIQVANWLSHQKIDKPSKSKIPAPNEASIILAKPRECSSEDLDQGPGPKDQEGRGESAANAPPTPSPTVSPKLETSTVVALRQATDVDDALEIPTTLERRRGSRLPADWEPSLEMLDWAQAERPDLDLGQTLEKFRDYWISQPGQKGVKTDWTATYRNWVRNEKPGARASKKSATTQAADALIARFAND